MQFKSLRLTLSRRRPTRKRKPRHCPRSSRTFRSTRNSGTERNGVIDEDAVLMTLTLTSLTLRPTILSRESALTVVRGKDRETMVCKILGGRRRRYPQS